MDSVKPAESTTLAKPCFIDLVTSGSRGLRLDAEIVHDILSPPCRAQINVSRQRNAHLLHRRLLKRLENRWRKGNRIILFFEILPTAWVSLASTKILIPNQEWMRDEVIKNLAQVSQIWCKTRYAEDIFRRRGFNARYIGFSSRDVYLPGIAKDYERFIHVAGRSHLKGTRTILELWQTHPHWPQLLVIASNKGWRRYASKNVFIRNDDVDQDELHALMNACGVHLCPSETEGNGHYISEALSTKALVVTTAAPPMNELVSHAHGLLVRYGKVEPQSFCQRFLVDPNDLERQIEVALEMSHDEKAFIGEAGRDAYLKRDTAFAKNLRHAIRELTIELCW